MNSVESTTDHLATTLPLGYSMLQKMGWKENTPLGIRGRGIMTPITDSMDIRLNGDYRGLGFESAIEETLLSIDGEEKGVDIKVIKVGERYGVGMSDFGQVFIPTGALKHLNNITGYTRRQLVGLRLLTNITASDGQYPWRLQKIETLMSNSNLQPVIFVGYYPMFNGYPYHAKMDFELDCGMGVMDHLF
jgi:hypothetical protein